MIACFTPHFQAWPDIRKRFVPVILSATCSVGRVASLAADEIDQGRHPGVGAAFLD
jgi:hypothetical protein